MPIADPVWKQEGGKVGIYTGMLPIAKTEAGLATVIAHEVAHAVARHGAEQMSEQLGGQLFAITLINSLSEMDEGTRALVFAAYGLGMTFGRTLPHSRLQETEADAIGLMYMARAGYDPEEAIKFWERFSEYKIENLSTGSYIIKLYTESGSVSKQVLVK